MRVLKAANKKDSVDTFNSRSPANEIIALLAVFSHSSHDKGSSEKTSYAWGQVDMHRFAVSLIAVSNGVRAILMAEKRMLDIASPVYVLGT